MFLILTLNLLFSLGHWPLQQQFKANPPLALTVFLLVLTFTVILLLLHTGFQRSVYLKGWKRQSPLALVHLGKHFLWRAVGLWLLLMFAGVLLAWLAFLIIRHPLAVSSGFWKAAQTDPLVYFGCYAVSGLMLIKPMLLLLPILVVHDCQISASFRLLRQHRMSEAQGLATVFVIFTLLTVMWGFLPSGEAARTGLHWILHIPLSLTQCFIGLMIGVMAVGFVGSAGVLQDDSTAGSDPENLL